jgi:hypothetical protein
LCRRFLSSTGIFEVSTPGTLIATHARVDLSYCEFHGDEFSEINCKGLPINGWSFSLVLRMGTVDFSAIMLLFGRWERLIAHRMLHLGVIYCWFLMLQAQANGSPEWCVRNGSAPPGYRVRTESPHRVPTSFSQAALMTQLLCLEVWRALRGQVLGICFAILVLQFFGWRWMKTPFGGGCSVPRRGASSAQRTGHPALREKGAQCSEIRAHPVLRARCFCSQRGACRSGGSLGLPALV